MLIDTGTYAYDAYRNTDTPDYMSNVDATAWFDVPLWLADETLLEESRYFRGLGFGMSLLWISKGRLLRY